jgi:tetratricopeptide (TPR) repeat protein
MHQLYPFPVHSRPFKCLLLLSVLFFFQGNLAMSAEKEPAKESTLETFYPEEFLPIVKHVCADNPEMALKVSRKQQKSSKSRQDALYAFFEGLSYLRLKQFEKAAEKLRLSWSLRKSSSDTLYFLGIALYQIDQEQQALQFLKEAAWFNRNIIVPTETIYERMGIIARSKDELPTAISFFEKSISSNPQYIPARIQLAALYEATEELDRAKTQMEAIQKKLAEPAEDEESEASLCSITAVRKLLLGTERSPIDVKILNARYALSQVVSTGSKILAKNTTRDLNALLELDSLTNQQRAEAVSLLTRAFLLNRDLEGARTSLAQLKELSPSHPAVEGLTTALETEASAAAQEQIDLQTLREAGES